MIDVLVTVKIGDRHHMHKVMPGQTLHQAFAQLVEYLGAVREMPRTGTQNIDGPIDELRAQPAHFFRGEHASQ